MKKFKITTKPEPLLEDMPKDVDFPSKKTWEGFTEFPGKTYFAEYDEANQAMSVVQEGFPHRTYDVVMVAPKQSKSIPENACKVELTDIIAGNQITGVLRGNPTYAHTTGPLGIIESVEEIN